MSIELHSVFVRLDGASMATCAGHLTTPVPLGLMRCERARGTNSNALVETIADMDSQPRVAQGLAYEIERE